MLTSCTPGAMPLGYRLVVEVRAPAMMPATCVPWPYSSAVDGSSASMLTFATTLPFSAACERDAGVDDRDADALPGHARDAADAEQPARCRPTSGRRRSTSTATDIDGRTSGSPDR